MITEISAEMLAKVAEFEGFRAKAYKCPAGVWTIGYGHTGPDVTARGLTVGTELYQEIGKAMAIVLLSMDISTAEAEVCKLQKETGGALEQCEFDALVSFVYNVGAGNFRASTLRKVVLQRPHDKAAVTAQIMRWNKAGGKVQPGLMKRRTIEAAWYNAGPDAWWPGKN